MRSPRVRRQRERVVGFEEAPNREGGGIERNVEGGGPLKLRARENGSHQPSINIRGNLPLNGTHLSHNDQTFIPSSFHPSNRFRSARVNSYSQPFIDLPSTYKGLMENTYTWIEAREVATNGALNDRRESFKRFKKTSWDNNRGQRNRDRFSPYRGSNHGLLSNLSKSPREILPTEKAAKSFEQPPRLPGNKWSRDKTKYCHFHEDHGHDTNQCRELKHQIKEAVKSGQLAHLVKGIKKKKEKMSHTQLGEWKKGGKDTTPIEAPVLIINRKGHSLKKRPVEEDHNDVGEITFPPLSKTSSADPVIIKAYISGRKLKPSIRSLQVDSNIPLVGFSGEHSWPLGEVPLEITIGEGPLTRTKTLNFVIVRSDSPHNLLLGRTAMQQMGIVVSTIHGAIKFHTPRGIGTILLEYKSYRTDEEQEETNKTPEEGMKDILSYVDADE
ncbi:hypothetical protein Tco_0786422 [Tanacetum coccineum]